MKVTGCSMGCMYAEGPISKCQCPCGGKTHGLMVVQVKVECTPSVAARCKGGSEDGECKCACGGVNHGLYREVPNFEHIPITTYAA